ncbi:hypothetical protein ACVIQT_008021 [Bradyrhizobium diazoefficiens]
MTQNTRAINPPRMLASQPIASGIVRLAEGLSCPCGAPVPPYPKPTTYDDGFQILCLNHHVVLELAR